MSVPELPQTPDIPDISEVSTSFDTGGFPMSTDEIGETSIDGLGETPLSLANSVEPPEGAGFNLDDYKIDSSDPCAMLINGIIGAVGAVWDAAVKLYEQISGMCKSMWDAMKALPGKVSAAIKSLWKKAKGLYAKVKAFVKGLSLPSMPSGSISIPSITLCGYEAGGWEIPYGGGAPEPPESDLNFDDYGNPVSTDEIGQTPIDASELDGTSPILEGSW